MTRWRVSATTRLALAVAAGILLSSILLGTSVYYAVSTQLLQDARVLVRADMGALRDIYRSGGGTALLGELNARIEDEGDPDAVYAMADAKGRALLGRLPKTLAPDVHRHWVEFNEENPDGGAPLRVIAVEQRLSHGETVLVGQRLRAQDRFLSLMQKTALMALLFAAALGALVGWITSRWVARRLRHLDATAARVGLGELGLRVPLDHSRDAFDQVAHRFNIMLDRIEELLDGVRHATDHIAHDLRTPLTRLRNRLERVRQRVSEPNEQRALDQALLETDQLLQTFSALLRLARIEAQPLAETAPLLDFKRLIEDAVEMYAPVADERALQLVTALAPVCLRGDRDQLFQLITNLLDNALKFAPTGSAIQVELHVLQANVQLVVADRGPGIPEAERERVFDRFQRIEPHRGTPGFGLGLSLARAIAKHHGGRIELHDNAPGLRVDVIWPLP